MSDIRNPHLLPGEVRLLDGATGTELQRRGVPMSTQAWSGPAVLRAGAVLRQIHRDYIEAGADIITGNTYATSRQLLAVDGFGDRFEEINRAAVELAQAAREDCGRPDVLIAGSLSHRGAIAPGTARPDRRSSSAADEMFASLSELAVFLRDAGCDLILLEMLYDPELIPVVLAAAAESGLPVWAGFSVRRGPDGRVLGFGPDRDIPFTQIVSVLNDRDVAAAGIMHTPSGLISDALAVLRNAYHGPLLAYPDSGHFRSPNWEFEDVIPPTDLRDFAERWILEGAQVVGGCCGLGPEHIKALKPLRRAPT